jgi:hypothetical protein
MHASDTLGWQQYFDDNYSFSPRSGSGASIQVVGNNGEGPSALSVGDNGQMGTLVYTVNGSTFYYNCTANNPAQYVIYREVDDTGRTLEQASIEAICQLE